LKREIGLLKKLSHPNIVGYYNFDVDEQNKRVEIVLEKVTPGNLKDIVKEKPFK
jgi:serine/threonine protein kinase